MHTASFKIYQRSTTPSQASLEADEGRVTGFIDGDLPQGCTRSHPSGAHHASEGWTRSAGLPALLEAASRVVPFIACAIGISCA